MSNLPKDVGTRICVSCGEHVQTAVHGGTVGGMGVIAVENMGTCHGCEELQLTKVSFVKYFVEYRDLDRYCST